MLEKILNIGINPGDNLYWQKRKRFLNSVVLFSIVLGLFMSLVNGTVYAIDGHGLAPFCLDLSVSVLLLLVFVAHSKLGYGFAAWLYLILVAIFITVFSLLVKHVDIEYFLLVLMVFGFAFFDSYTNIIISGLINFGLFAFVKVFEEKISFPSSTLALMPMSPINPNHIIMFLAMALLVWTMKREAMLSGQIIRKQNNELLKKNKELNLQKQMVETLYNNLIDSIAYAQRIQFSFFPSRQQLNARLGDYGLVFLPKEGISGDFYMLYRLGEDDVFVLGDCTGHGMSGSLLSIMFMVTLKQVFEKANINDWSLVDILENMRREIKDDLRYFSQERAEGADLAIVRISRDKKKLIFAGANMDMFLIRSGVMYIFKGIKSPIGFYFKELDFEQDEFELEPGDRIVLFTDGMVDQISPQGRRFSTAKFKKILLDTAEMKPSEQASLLLDKFLEWKGDYLQTDDVTMIIFDV